VRILLVAAMVPAADGPGATPVLLDGLVHALAGRHELTVVAGIGAEPWEEPAARAMSLAPAEVHLADRRIPPTLRRRLRRRARLASDWLLTRQPWLVLWFAAPAIQAVVDDLAARTRFDLVLVEDTSVATFRFPAGVPTVLTTHEVRAPRPPIWRPGPPAEWVPWAYREIDWHRWQGFQRSVWRRFDRLQVLTERDARVVAELAPDVADRIRVNPFGLDLPPVASVSGEEPGTVLFVGNFTHAPNVDGAAWLAREIMPQVRSAAPDARLLIVGSDPPAEVLSLAGDGVEVVADVPDVEPYLDAAAVFAAPVRFGGGMRMKVLSALAAGKAVVTTTRGAEGYEQPGRELPMVISDDAGGLADAIAGLLRDPKRRHALGRDARAFAEAFHSPDAWADRLDRVFEELCGQSSSGS
jgi:glycosyltransferase involved in cell wall biosynthesis